MRGGNTLMKESVRWFPATCDLLTLLHNAVCRTHLELHGGHTPVWETTSMFIHLQRIFPAKLQFSLRHHAVSDNCEIYCRFHSYTCTLGFLFLVLLA